jgi:hypothetical protein
MNTDLESLLKEVLMTEFQHFSGETGIPQMIHRLVSVPTEIWTGRLPNSDQKRYRLSQLAK